VPAESTTYPDLFRIPTFPRLASSVVLARTANAMMQLALVLFTLQRFHSPTLAGVTIFLAIAPGIAVSPIAGALLDRHGRVRLIMLDYAVGALSLFLIAGLDAAGRLTPAVLLPIVTVGALTYSLSNSGARSLLPLIVPSRLWDRANALDSMAYAVTGAAGPALAGGLTAGFGPRVALLASAAFFVAAALPMVGLTEPVARGGTTSVLGDAREGLVYVVVRNASLRGLAIVIGLVNAGFGILIVALPVMIFQRVHGDAALVGEVWALLGLGSALSVIYFGRHSSEGWYGCARGHRQRDRRRRRHGIHGDRQWSGRHRAVLDAAAPHRPGLVRTRLRHLDVAEFCRDAARVRHLRSADSHRADGSDRRRHRVAAARRRADPAADSQNGWV